MFLEGICPTCPGGSGLRKGGWNSGCIAKAGRTARLGQLCESAGSADRIYIYIASFRHAPKQSVYASFLISATDL